MTKVKTSSWDIQGSKKFQGLCCYKKCLRTILLNDMLVVHRNSYLLNLIILSTLCRWQHVQVAPQVTTVAAQPPAQLSVHQAHTLLEVLHHVQVVPQVSHVSTPPSHLSTVTRDTTVQRW